jgi:hypothetical protein
MNFDVLDRESLAQILAVANTPQYLYKHFRSDPSIEALSRTTTIEDLFLFVRQQATKRERTFEDSVLAYAALVAITYKPSNDIRAILDREGIPRFKWAHDIIEGYLLAAPPTQLIVPTVHSAGLRDMGATRSVASNTVIAKTQRAVVSPLVESSVVSNSPVQIIVVGGNHND